MKRKTPLSHHPFMEEAALLRELLRQDKEEDRRGTGRVIIPGDPDYEIPRIKNRIKELEHLAEIDVDYPIEDAEV